MNVSKILILAYILCQLLIVAVLFQAKSMVGRDKQTEARKASNTYRSDNQ